MKNELKWLLALVGISCLPLAYLSFGKYIPERDVSALKGVHYTPPHWP